MIRRVGGHGNSSAAMPPLASELRELRSVLLSGIASGEEADAASAAPSIGSGSVQRRGGPPRERPVRVLCRFRGQLSGERQRGGVECWTIESDSVSCSDASFPFDHVFGPKAGQAEIYDAVEPTVQDVLAGGNGAILCYGQTSAGKTFTMEGDALEPGHDLSGIIPRSLATLLASTAESGVAGPVQLRLAMLDIHMDKLRDLLAPESGAELQIFYDRSLGVCVRGQTDVVVRDLRCALEIFRAGQSNRATAATGMNDRSSRSHSILSVRAERYDGSRLGKLCLVDLAGSECLKKSRRRGDGMTAINAMIAEEAKAINQSLTTLGLVINRLADRRQPGDLSHIPYRSSKLTRILQDTLGGNSQTILVVNCAISSLHAPETLSTLRFGARARSVVNVVTDSQTDQTALLLETLQAARLEIQQLRARCSSSAAPPEALGHSYLNSELSPIAALPSSRRQSLGAPWRDPLDGAWSPSNRRRLSRRLSRSAAQSRRVSLANIESEPASPRAGSVSPLLLSNAVSRRVSTAGNKRSCRASDARSEAAFSLLELSCGPSRRTSRAHRLSCGAAGRGMRPPADESDEDEAVCPEAQPQQSLLADVPAAPRINTLFEHSLSHRLSVSGSTARGLQSWEYPLARQEKLYRLLFVTEKDADRAEADASRLLSQCDALQAENEFLTAERMQLMEQRVRTSLEDSGFALSVVAGDLDDEGAGCTRQKISEAVERADVAETRASAAEARALFAEEQFAALKAELATLEQAHSSLQDGLAMQREEASKTLQAAEDAALDATTQYEEKTRWAEARLLAEVQRAQALEAALRSAEAAAAAADEQKKVERDRAAGELKMAEDARDQALQRAEEVARKARAEAERQEAEQSRAQGALQELTEEKERAADRLKVAEDTLRSVRADQDQTQDEFRWAEKRAREAEERMHAVLEEHAPLKEHLQAARQQAHAAEEELQALQGKQAQADEEKHAAREQMRATQEELRALLEAQAPLNTQLQAAQERIETAEQEAQALRGEQEALRQQLESKGQQVFAAEEELQALRSELGPLKEQLLVARQKSQAAEEDLQTLDSQRALLQEQLLAAQQQAQAAEEDLQTLDSQRALLQEQLLAAQQQAQAAEEAFQALLGEHAPLKEQLEVLQQQARSAEDDMQTLHSQQALSQERLTAAQQQARVAEEALSALEGEHAPLREQLEAAQQQACLAEERLTAAQQQARVAEEALSALQGEHTPLREQLEAAQQQARLAEEALSALQGEHTPLREQLEAAQQQARLAEGELHAFQGKHEEELRKQMQHLQEQTHAAEDGRQALQRELALLRDQLQTAQQHSRAAEAELNAVQGEHAPLKEQLSLLQQEALAAKAELKAVLGEHAPLKEQFSLLEQEALAAKEELQKLQGQHEALQERLRAAQLQEQDAKADVATRMAADDALKARLQEAEQQAAAAKAETDTLQREREPLKEALEALRQQEHAAKEELRALVTTCEPSKQRLQEAEDELLVAKAQLQAMQLEQDPLREQLKESQGEEHRFEAELEVLRSQQEPLQLRLQAAEQEATESQAELETLRSQHEALQLRLQEKIEELQSQHEPLSEKLHAAEQEARTMKENIKELQSQHEPLSEKLHAAEQEARTVKEKLAALQVEHEPLAEQLHVAEEEGRAARDALAALQQEHEQKLQSLLREADRKAADVFQEEAETLRNQQKLTQKHLHEAAEQIRQTQEELGTLRGQQETLREQLLRAEQRAVAAEESEAKKYIDRLSEEELEALQRLPEESSKHEERSFASSEQPTPSKHSRDSMSFLDEQALREKLRASELKAAMAVQAAAEAEDRREACEAALKAEAEAATTVADETVVMAEQRATAALREAAEASARVRSLEAKLRETEERRQTATSRASYQPDQSLQTPSKKRDSALSAALGVPTPSRSSLEHSEKLEALQQALAASRQDAEAIREELRACRVCATPSKSPADRDLTVQMTPAPAEADEEEMRRQLREVTDLQALLEQRVRDAEQRAMDAETLAANSKAALARSLSAARSQVEEAEAATAAVEEQLQQAVAKAADAERAAEDLQKQLEDTSVAVGGAGVPAAQPVAETDAQAASPSCGWVPCASSSVRSVLMSLLFKLLMMVLPFLLGLHNGNSLPYEISGGLAFDVQKSFLPWRSWAGASGEAVDEGRDEVMTYGDRLAKANKSWLLELDAKMADSSDRLVAEQDVETSQADTEDGELLDSASQTAEQLSMLQEASRPPLSVGALLLALIGGASRWILA
eukprot:TRINITY_DN3959_c0_g1_i7.p1 TRINITY_DN3959_c0_g1~~TRINITY_DN3959_c0_g1_i7.p1  ORF type:complete len:2262 (-),score=730.13 TRINITY_DN3959_c0_g1_i7:135-6920(-)